MSSLKVYMASCRVGWADWEIFWNVRTWLFGWLVRITTNAGMWIMLGLLLQSSRLTQYLFLGYSIAVGATSTLWAVPSAYWDRQAGVHPLQVASPVPMFASLLGRTSIWLLNGWATGLLALPVLTLAFGMHLSTPVWLAFPLILLVCCLTTYAFSLAIGAVVARAPNFRNVASGVAGSALLAFTGVLVPPAFWSHQIQQVAQFLPMTHGVAAFRDIASGASTLSIGEKLLHELAVGVMWLMLAYLALVVVVYVERRKGWVDRA
jgi:ABC-2 type transport system permease protein